MSSRQFLREHLYQMLFYFNIATSGGGPQIGQPFDPPIKNVVVENLIADGTGDDSIGLFNVERYISHFFFPLDLLFGELTTSQIIQYFCIISMTKTLVSF